MRTMTSSIAKTCPECGTMNRLVILTTGMTPTWRICCSQCAAIIVEPRTNLNQPPASPPANITGLPVFAANTARRPRRMERKATAVRLRHPQRPRLCEVAKSTGIGVVAACGLALAVLLTGHADGPIGIGMFDATETTISTDAVSSNQIAAAPATEPDTATILPERSSFPPEPTLSSKAPALGSAMRAAGDDAPIIAGHRLASIEPSLPDLREGLERLHVAALADPVMAASAEARLELSPTERREIQRRLRLAKHDPKGVDGIIGPASRAAIAAWQDEAGLPATGFLTMSTLTRLVIETDEAYRNWQVAQAERRAREQRLASAAPLPRPQHGSTEGCARNGSGDIAYGQNLRCDIRGLSESLGAVGEKLAQVFASSEQPRARRRGPGDA